MRPTALPLALMAVLLGGCIYIPGPEVGDRMSGAGPSIRPDNLLGDAKSSKPIRPGVSREEVGSILGRPDFANPDRTLEEYRYSVHFGSVFYIVPLGHVWGDHTYAISHDMNLMIQFDQEGHVRSWSFDPQTISREPGVRRINSLDSVPPGTRPETQSSTH